MILTHRNHVRFATVHSAIVFRSPLETCIDEFYGRMVLPAFGKSFSTIFERRQVMFIALDCSPQHRQVLARHRMKEHVWDLDAMSAVRVTLSDGGLPLILTEGRQ